MTEALAQADARSPRRRLLPTVAAWLSDRLVGGGLVLALAAAALGVVACLNGGLLGLASQLAGPGVVRAEAYPQDTGGPAFDHAVFDRVLRKHVSKEGWVDYAALHKDTGDLDAYIADVGLAGQLAGAAFDKLGRDEKLALLINAYNAFTLRLILDHYPLKSIRDIPERKRWDARRWRLGGSTYSLNDLEHKEIRPKFKEPRIHFALVCAAVGCPPLRNEAYTADRLEAQLDEQTRIVHAGKRWFRFDAAKNVVFLTRLYKWYGGDFKQTAGSVLDYVARYAPPIKSALTTKRPPKIDWLDYDWSLNSKQNAR